MQQHDTLYHRLFSHPEMVTQLLREFVAEPWLADLDLASMQRVNAKFHAITGQRRESDVIWRIPLRTGGDAYLLLMLEFQSTPDRWMALRVMVYAGLLWQHIINERRLLPDGRLPPVFPLVLYNGDPLWTAPPDLDPLIGLPSGSPLWPWQPRMRYQLDEGTFAEADLAARDTLAALLFRLENATEPDRIDEIVDAVIDWFRRHDGFEALKPIFAALASRVLEMAEGATPGVRVTENLLEVKTMLANRPAEWRARWTEEGRREGQLQGERKGVAAVLTGQLERRFGALPEATARRIAEADITLLQDWSLRLLDAASIDDVIR